MLFDKSFLIMVVMLMTSITFFTILMVKLMKKKKDEFLIISLRDVETIARWIIVAGTTMWFWFSVHLFGLDEYTNLHLLVLCAMMYVELCIMIISDSIRRRCR